MSALEVMWGKEIFRTRLHMLTIVSGYGISESKYRALITSYYRRFRDFSNYVDESILFGDDELSFITKLISPIREILDKKKETTIRELTSAGGKILLEGDEYVYAAFRSGIAIPEIHGLEVIN